MGSRIATRNRRRAIVYALLAKLERGEELSNNDKAFFSRNCRRHRRVAP